MSTYGSGTYGSASGTYGDLVGFVEPATTRIIAVSGREPAMSTAGRRTAVLTASSREPALTGASSREPEA